MLNRREMMASLAAGLLLPEITQAKDERLEFIDIIKEKMKYYDEFKDCSLTNASKFSLMEALDTSTWLINQWCFDGKINSLKFNENADAVKTSLEYTNPVHKHYSTKMLLSTLHNTNLNKIINMWAVTKENECSWWFDNGKYVKGKPFAIKKHKMKCVWSCSPQDDINKMPTEIFEIICNELRFELYALTIQQIRSKKIHQINSNNFPAGLHQASEKIKNSSGKTPNWVVADKEILESLGIPPKNKTSLDLEFVGTKDGYQIYHYPLLPVNEMLVGYKGIESFEDYFSGGICLGIKTPYAPTDIVIDPESRVPRHGLTTEKDFQWKENGEKLYASVKVKR